MRFVGEKRKRVVFQVQVRPLGDGDGTSSEEVASLAAALEQVASRLRRSAQRSYRKKVSTEYHGTIPTPSDSGEVACVKGSK